MKHHKQQWRCFFLMGAVVLCWAYSPVGIRIGLTLYSPGELALLRFIAGSSVLLLIALVQKVPLPKLKDLPIFFLLGFFAVTLHHLCLNTAQPYVTAAASSVLTQSTPIFSIFFSALILREHITKRCLICVLLGMVGSLVAIQAGGAAQEFDWHALLILVAAMSWSIYFLLQKKYTASYGPLTLTCYAIWAGTAMLGIYYTPGLVERTLHAPPAINIAVMTLGIFPSALAYLWWGSVLEVMDVTQATPALYLIPPVSMWMASALLNEKTPAQVIIGGLIVIVSVLLINARPKINTNTDSEKSWGCGTTEARPGDRP